MTKVQYTEWDSNTKLLKIWCPLHLTMDALGRSADRQEKGVLKKAEFKIVYVAPMKALAAEMAAGFGKRLEPLGKTL